MANTILVVDDEKNIVQLARLYLGNEGFQVEEAYDGKQALEKARSTNPDLIVLDIMMPEMDGISVCKELRKTSNVPVIILTARDDDVDKIVGLEVGADDYVTKPFSPKELVARVRAVLRRTRPAASVPVLDAGTLSMDTSAHRATLGGAPLPLTPKEFDLLQTLLASAGRVLSREHLLNRVWGYARADEIESRTVDVHIRRLRAKLGPEGRRIATVKGVGYRLDPD